MQINHNLPALNTLRQLSINNAASSKSMEKLSSGYRINRAADDAAGLSISEKMRSQIRGLNQSVRNAQDGISFIQTAEGALNEVSDMLVRMKELGVQKASGTYDAATDVVNINAEIDALNSAIGEIKTKTKFNGIDVFGTGATIAYGETANSAVTIAVAAGVTGLNISSASATLIADIDGAINTVNTQRATYGAQQNQLEHCVNNMNTTSENLQAAESRIRDVDMAAEMVQFTKNNILVSAAQAMLAQANSQPQGILQLLR